MKKLTSILMVVVIVLSVAFVTPAFAEESTQPQATENISVWDGNIPTLTTTSLDALFAKKDDYYQLSSAADVAKLAAFVNAGNSTVSKKFKLCCDIDLNSQKWQGIGMNVTNSDDNNDKAFKGEFDGNGHVVYNLNLADTVASTRITAGFFGWIASGANIHDFGIASGEISASAVAGQDRVGTLVGAMGGNATIKNCFNMANLNVTVTNNNIGIGGLVGQVNGLCSAGTATIKNCSNTGNLNLTPDQTRYNIRVGGIVGDVVNNVTVENTTSIGDVVYTDVSKGHVNNCFGQIAGQVSTNGTITCKNLKLGGDVKVASNLGSRGLLFGTFKGTLNATDCYYNVTAYGYQSGVFVVKDANLIAKDNNTTATNTDGFTATTDDIDIISAAIINTNTAQEHKDGGKIRFNSELTFSKDAFSETGYVIEFGSRTATLSGRVVYSSLLAIVDEEETSVKPTGGKYFISYGLSDIPSNATGTMKVTPYVVLLDGQTRVYGESGTYEIENGTLKTTNQ